MPDNDMIDGELRSCAFATQSDAWGITVAFPDGHRLSLADVPGGDHR